MAPRKPRADAQAKKSPAKRNNNRVVKRPARGYHTFKNGMLNVTPKGNENEMYVSTATSGISTMASWILKLNAETDALIV